jgi:hypothetical protein
MFQTKQSPVGVKSLAQTFTVLQHCERSDISQIVVSETIVQMEHYKEATKDAVFAEWVRILDATPDKAVHRSVALLALRSVFGPTVSNYKLLVPAYKDAKSGIENRTFDFNARVFALHAHGPFDFAAIRSRTKLSKEAYVAAFNNMFGTTNEPNPDSNIID